MRCRLYPAILLTAAALVPAIPADASGRRQNAAWASADDELAGGLYEAPVAGKAAAPGAAATEAPIVVEAAVLPAADNGQEVSVERQEDVLSVAEGPEPAGRRLLTWQGRNHW
ncbi:MAG: hypothetical protein KDA53_06700 [Hyphomonas sp.]|nr:hypothetical protein [Hyphomonas sp.]